MLMATNYSEFGIACQPHSEGFSPYRFRMTEIDSRKVLWANLARLMDARYGKENITRLATEARIGPASVTRLKGQATSFGVEILDKLAAVFEVQPWQLLVPNLDPENLPNLGGSADQWPMPMVNEQRFRNLPVEDRIYVQGYVNRAIEEREAAISRSAMKESRAA